MFGAMELLAQGAELELLYFEMGETLSLTLQGGTASAEKIEDLIERRSQVRQLHKTVVFFLLNPTCAVEVVNRLDKVGSSLSMMRVMEKTDMVTRWVEEWKVDREFEEVPDNLLLE